MGRARRCARSPPFPPPPFHARAPSPTLLQTEEAAKTFREEILPELQAARAVRAVREQQSKEAELEKLRGEMFGEDAGFAAAAARAAAKKAAGGGRGGAAGSSASALGGGGGGSGK